MALTSTQIGTIGENLLVNAVMKASDWRLSPFQPYADDDGLDVLFYDKQTGNSVAIQLKCRTVTLYKAGTRERGNVVHFGVRQATFRATRHTYLVAALISPDFSNFEALWLVPMERLPEVAGNISGNWVVRANKNQATADRYSAYRCPSVSELASKIIAACESRG